MAFHAIRGGGGTILLAAGAESVSRTTAQVHGCPNQAAYYTRPEALGRAVDRRPASRLLEDGEPPDVYLAWSAAKT